MTAPLTDYAEVIAILRPLLAGVTEDDLPRPTPCSKWDVRRLVGHVLEAIEYYASLAREGEVPSGPVTIMVEPRADLAAMFDAAARGGMEAWSAPGVLDSEVRMVLGPMRGRSALAIHVADLTVHAWDVATALGKPADLPPDLADTARATWERVLSNRELRGIVFTEEVAVAADADATARLVAYCGRCP
jgi:uncharacterized protein (TIGR03086 family)